MKREEKRERDDEKENEREDQEFKKKIKRDRDEKIRICFLKNVREPSNPPDELAQNVSKKSFSDEFFIIFFRTF